MASFFSFNKIVEKFSLFLSILFFFFCFQGEEKKSFSPSPLENTTINNYPQATRELRDGVIVVVVVVVNSPFCQREGVGGGKGGGEIVVMRRADKYIPKYFLKRGPKKEKEGNREETLPLLPVWMRWVTQEL